MDEMRLRRQRWSAAGCSQPPLHSLDSWRRRTVRKLGAADAVVDLDVLFSDGPPFTLGVLARVLNLPYARFLFVGHTGLFA